MKRIAELVLVLAVALQQGAFAQVPQLINYQGRLLNGTNLVNGNVSLALRLFNAPTGGTLLYEDSNIVAVVDGLYSTMIGDGTSYGSLSVALTNAQVWIEVMVNSTILSPRERLTSVGYSLLAQGVVPNGITSSMIADGAVQSVNIATGAVSNVNLATGSVGSAQLATNIGVWVKNGTSISYSSGNVGIGTATPQAGLHITSAPQWSGHNLGANILVDGGRNNAIGFLDAESSKPWAIFNGAGQLRMAQMPPLGDVVNPPAHRFTISTNGNVGIGTLTPAEPLEVAGRILLNGPNSNLHGVDFSSLANSGKLLIGANRSGGEGETDFIANRGGGGVGGFAFFDMPNSGTTNQLMTLKGDGNVGIGTATPTHELTVQAPSGSDVISFRNPSYELGRLGIGAHADGGSLWLKSDGAWKVAINADDVTYFNGGNVGIGTATPAEPLEVAGRILLNGPDGNLDGHDLSSLTNSAKLLIGWNQSGGEGEADFIANRGAGDVGGFSFFDMANSGTLNQLMTLKGNGNVGIGTTAPGAKLHVEGQIRIVGGCPGAGKLLVSDADGLASWQSPSALSLFIGQDYTVLFPDVIDNTVAIQIQGVFTEEGVVMVNGPGLQIERILGFNGTNHNDNPGSNMEFPLVFEYGGSQTNALQTWYQQNQTAPDRKMMSVIVKDLGGTERARWNLYEMVLTQIDPGSGARQRYTIRHALVPNNVFSYEREPGAFPANSSRNPATDGPRIEIQGLNVGPYPAVAVDTTNRTITLTFDYTEAGKIYEWVDDTASGLSEKHSMSIIQEVNGVEVSRRNYFETFPIWYQQTTGFGQIEKLKEKVVISYDWDESG